MLKHCNSVLVQDSFRRKGVAAVECAVVSPLLVLITLGAIDSGQFVNMAQVVNDASYEGARQASQNVATQAEVREAVLNYFTEQFPSASSTQINSALTVNVYRSQNLSLQEGEMSEVPNGDLSVISTGEPVAVQVLFQYDTIRWLTGFPGLDGQSVETTTAMRRE